MQPLERVDSSDNPPSYPGEDTRLTSPKELSGWYSYGWAAEVFVICGIGILAIYAGPDPDGLTLTP